MSNPRVEKIKLDYGYEKCIKDKIMINYLKTIRFNFKNVKKSSY